VEANVAPDQAVVSSRAGRGTRILLVWGVRFTGECLAELLERDPSVSVIGLCADLSEAVALSAAMQSDKVLMDGRMMRQSGQKIASASQILFTPK
jgi:hypothetical protein